MPRARQRERWFRHAIDRDHAEAVVKLRRNPALLLEDVGERPVAPDVKLHLPLDEVRRRKNDVRRREARIVIEVREESFFPFRVGNSKRRIDA